MLDIVQQTQSSVLGFVLKKNPSFKSNVTMMFISASLIYFPKLMETIQENNFFAGNVSQN